MTKCESYDLTAWGKPFEKAVREIPDLPDKAVLVRVTAAGLCHSDLHIKKGFKKELNTKFLIVLSFLINIV